MKATLEFDLKSSVEAEHYGAALKGMEYKDKLVDIFNMCRDYIRYEDSALNKAEQIIEQIKNLAASSIIED